MQGKHATGAASGMSIGGGARRGQSGGRSPIQAYDSDDHDDFNPIKDLMPPSIANEEIDLIGKKRMREKDPLLRLVEESQPANAGLNDANQVKRQKSSPENDGNRPVSGATDRYER